MMDLYPMGILKNTVTGKYHPIAFRQNPMPGLADLEPGSTGHRYKSLGNDPVGYDTIDQARETVRDRQEHFLYRLTNLGYAVLEAFNSDEYPRPSYLGVTKTWATLRP